MSKRINMLLLFIPYMIGIIIFICGSTRFNFIHYLLVMILPIGIGAIEAMLLKKQRLIHGEPLGLSAVCTLMYAVFFGIIIFFSQFNDTMDYIYENSKELFTEGFSIESNFTINISDMFLPLCVCFVIHFASFKLCDKQNSLNS